MSGLNQKYLIFTGNCNAKFADYITLKYKIPTEKINVVKMDLDEALALKKEIGIDDVLIFDIVDNEVKRKYGFGIKSITYGYKNPKVFKLICDWIYKEIKKKWAKYLK